MYGHIETLAHIIVEDAQSVDGVEVTLKHVSETMPVEALKAAGTRGSRHPSDNELSIARYQGEKVARLATRFNG